MSQGLPVFDKFIQDLRAVWGELPDMESRMKRAARLLEGLVTDPTLREHSKGWPSTEGAPGAPQNLLFYEDPDYGFAVNGVVRTPGRSGGVHDHGQTWTAYGVLDGTEKLERYRRLDAGQKQGYAELELESASEGVPGTVDLVPPYSIHSEKGGPKRSVAVIVRSLSFGRRGFQSRYDPEKRTCAQSQGPAQVPFEIR